ncbi:MULTISPECIES: hypothetical protein [unclassified Paenibacillus]|uniref:hypothetical protein n=1 Tax=unclassified Paenibacillus TaxID=185978 RepID=UPI0030F658A7
MEEISNEEQLQSIASMQSTIRKLESALTQMISSGSNTTLVQKRLNAMHIGLAVLDNVWNEKPLSYTPAELAEARHVLLGLTPSVESSYAKSKAGSPQRTLLERRLQALGQVIQAMDTL